MVHESIKFWHTWKAKTWIDNHWCYKLDYNHKSWEKWIYQPRIGNRGRNRARQEESNFRFWTTDPKSNYDVWSIAPILTRIVDWCYSCYFPFWFYHLMYLAFPVHKNLGEGRDIYDLHNIIPTRYQPNFLFLSQIIT